MTFEKEVKEKWGETEAYAQFKSKTKGYSKDRFTQINAGLEKIFRAFSKLMQSGEKAGSSAAQSLVKELQDYITEHYYTCTDEILTGLGKMYVGDARFKTNIDKHAAGTADFVGKAIQTFCKQK